jgi:hypothetical protein
MRVTLNLEADNDAFVPDAQWEIARILRSTATKIEHGMMAGPLMDANGNNVGTFTIEED